ncbi:MAG: TIGR00730 family Rossman fold protein [Saprospiraceae bacterium]|nr:TIGR00730 family Rossman fold protein [Saprospiraceae bacterium]
MLTSLAVFCGSSTGNNPEYASKTRDLGRYLAQKNIEVIYGAGNVGLMGQLADAALAEGGQVFGVIPGFLKEWEVCHTGLSDLVVTENMHARKAIMAERADGFIILPGGFGTLDEFFEILTWKQLHLHKKPIGLLNWEGYYDHLIAHVAKMVESGFLRAENTTLFSEDASIEGLLPKMLDGNGDLIKKWV